MTEMKNLRYRVQQAKTRYGKEELLVGEMYEKKFSSKEECLDWIEEAPGIGFGKLPIGNYKTQMLWLDDRDEECSMTAYYTLHRDKHGQEWFTKTKRKTYYD